MFSRRFDSMLGMLLMLMALLMITALIADLPTLWLAIDSLVILTGAIGGLLLLLRRPAR